MKKILSLAAAAAAGLSLVACGSSTSPPASPTTTAVDTDQFIDTLRNFGVTLPDDQIIKASQYTCETLAEGSGVEVATLSLIQKYDVGPSEAGALLGGSVAAYCPEFSADVMNS